MASSNDDRRDARAALKAALLEQLKQHRDRQFTPLAGGGDPWSARAWDRAGDCADVYWLECPYIPDGALTRFSLSAHLETTALFALVARVDLSLWQELTREHWTSDWERLDLIATRTAFQVGVEVLVCDDDEDLVAVSEALVAWLHAPRSDTFLRIQALAARVAGVEADVSMLPVVPVRLTVEDRLDELPRRLRRVCEVLAAHPQAAAVRLTQFKSGTDGVTLELGDIAALASLRAAGVEVTDLPLIGVQESLMTRPQCLQYVQTMLDTTMTPTREPQRNRQTRPQRGRSSGLPRQEPDGTQWISLSSSLPDALVPGVLSAVHASRSLRSVVLTLDVSRRRSTFLRWMAYGLLCRDEPLNQVTIRQSARLRMQDVDMMREIATAPNPLAVLFPEENVPNERHFVISNEAFLTDPRHTSDPTRWTQQSPATLEIIGASRQGIVPVLLPGWGKAWVRDEGASKVHARSDHGATEFGSPTRLNIYDAAETPALLAFIQLVGRHIKQLTIHEFSDQDTPINELGRQILSACPHLEEINANDVWFDSVEFVVDAFEAGECPALTKIDFFDVCLDSARGLDAMMRALADPESAMARQLKKIRMIFEPFPLGSASLPTLANEMLKRNTRLRAFELIVPGNDYLKSHELHVVEYDFVGDPMPMPRRCVLALLSAVSESRSGLQQLDSALVRQIVSFAGQQRVRTVITQFRG